MPGMRGRFKPQQPGNYIRVFLREPRPQESFGGRPPQVTLRLAGEFPETNIQTLPDSALLVIASQRNDGVVETFHFPARTISHWSTFTITPKHYADAVASYNAAIKEMSRP